MRKRSGGGSTGLEPEDTPFDPKLHTDSFLTSYLNSFNFVELNLGTEPWQYVVAYPVLWIRDIFVRICGSVPLTYGSGSWFFR